MNHNEYMKAIETCENNMLANLSQLERQEKTPTWKVEQIIKRKFTNLRMEIDERFQRPLPTHREHYWQNTDIVNASTCAAKEILFGSIRENQNCVTSASVAIVNAIRRYYGVTQHGWDESDNNASRAIETYFRQEIIPRIVSAISIEMARAETQQFIRAELGIKS